MRIPVVAIVFPVLAVLLGLGWRNHRRIAELNADRDCLAARAAALGEEIDSSRQKKSADDANHLRRDGMAEAKRLAADLLDHVRDLKNRDRMGALDDEALRRRIVELTRRAESLNGKQLLAVIEEICAAGDLNDWERRPVLGYLMNCLSRDHPLLVVETMMGTDNVAKTSLSRDLLRNPFGAAVYRWAEIDFQAALDWLRQHRGNFPDPDLERFAMGALIGFAVKHDPGMVRSLVGEFGEDPKQYLPIFAYAPKTPKLRRAALDTLLKWRSEEEDPQFKMIADEKIRQLLFGESFRPNNFEFATGWIEKAGLPQSEIESLLGRYDFNAKPSESGRWIEWLGRNLPPETASEHIWRLFPKWSECDYIAAGKWLATAPESPAKAAAIRRHAETVFAYDPEAAIRWAERLPEGAERKKTIKKLRGQ